MKSLTIIPENYNNEIIGATDEEVIRPAYCYMHGKLEKQFGYDIFHLLKSELPNEYINNKWVSKKFPNGIYTCKCLEQECVFFKWNNYGKNEGLVVLASDKDAYDYAIKCYTDSTNPQNY